MDKIILYYISKDINDSVSDYIDDKDYACTQASEMNVNNDGNVYNVYAIEHDDLGNEINRYPVCGVAADEYINDHNSCEFDDERNYDAENNFRLPKYDDGLDDELDEAKQNGHLINPANVDIITTNGNPENTNTNYVRSGKTDQLGIEHLAYFTTSELNNAKELFDRDKELSLYNVDPVSINRIYRDLCDKYGVDHIKQTRPYDYIAKLELVESLNEDVNNEKKIYLVFGCTGSELGYVYADDEDAAYKLAGEIWPEYVKMGYGINKDFMECQEVYEDEVCGNLDELYNDGYIYWSDACLAEKLYNISAPVINEAVEDEEDGVVDTNADEEVVETEEPEVVEDEVVVETEPEVETEVAVVEQPEESNVVKLIKKIKAASINLKTLHRNLEGGNWFTIHELIGEYYEAMDDFEDSIIENLMSLNLQDQEVDEKDLIETVPYTEEAAMNLVKAMFIELLNLSVATRTEVNIPTAVAPVFDEFENFLQIEANFKINKYSLDTDVEMDESFSNTILGETNPYSNYLLEDYEEVENDIDSDDLAEYDRDDVWSQTEKGLFHPENYMIENVPWDDDEWNDIRDKDLMPTSEWITYDEWEKFRNEAYDFYWLPFEEILMETTKNELDPITDESMDEYIANHPDCGIKKKQ